jgi:hypothetical protein
MAMPGTSACLTTEPTKPNASKLVANTPETLDSQAPGPGSPMKDAPPPLRSVHTRNFSAILHELGIPALAPTYQVSKLVMLHPDGARLTRNSAPSAGRWA